MSNNQLVDSCLLVNRRVEQRQEHSITHTEITQRRVLQDKGAEMQHYKSTIGSEAAGSVGDGGGGGGGGSYHGHSNGHSEHSPNSSHISVHSDEPLVGNVRTHKQQTTQQVTTVTKVVREVQHLGGQGGGQGDSGQVDYVSMPLGMYAHTHQHPHAHSQYMEYNPMEQSAAHHMYSHLQHPHPHPLGSESQYHPHSHYQDYEHYPVVGSYGGVPGGGPYGGGGSGGGAYMPYGMTGDRPSTPPSPSEHSGAPSPLPLPLASQRDGTGGTVGGGVGGYLSSGYDDMPDHYRVTPSPGGPINPMDPYQDDPAVVYGYVSPSPYGNRTYEETLNGPVTVGVGPMPPMRSMFEEEDLQKHMSKMSMSLHGHQLGVGVHPRSHGITSPGSAAGDDEQQRGMRWRDPNLTEVIGFLNNPNNVIKANAAAYLQHLCYMDDPNKQKTRALGGIPPLVKLLSHDSPDVFRNACGALRNLSYGRQNDENKRAIKNAGGIPALITLLRKSSESEVKELVTGVIWNMSSCEDLKRAIIDDGVAIVVTNIIIPHSGWDPQGNSGETCWSTVFRNASGVLRNVSSAGEYARKKLRECEGLVDALLYVVRCAIDKSNIGNKIVENCVCILRNLSYRCQEVEDPNYDKNPLPTQSRVTANAKGENLGCFGASKKKKDSQSVEVKERETGASHSHSNTTRTEPVKGVELLWQPEVVQSYLALLQSCSNPETLEAAAGALQNLAACYWQPSIEIRAAVRKEKGLPILVELLRMEVDRVVCAVATALRNLAIDQRNKELIGKYAMRDLVQKLPSGNPQHDQGTSDDTIAAVLATLNEVIKKNAEFSRSLLEAGGVERLMTITRQRQKYTPRVLKFSGQVLFTMWQHQELRDVYKKHGWKEQDFVTKTVAARNAGPNSPNNANSTLNRPMASQSGTRYEDRTMKRNAAPSRTVAPGVPGPGPGGPGGGGGGGIGSGGSGALPLYQRNEEIPMAEMAYPEGGMQSPTSAPPLVGGIRIYPPGPGPNLPPTVTALEPLYAQVNMDKKRNRQPSVAGSTNTNTNTNTNTSNHFDPGDHDDTRTHMTAGKDSWV